MATVFSRALLTAKELSAVRHFKVSSPLGTKCELDFLPWESLADVAKRASDYFGIPMRSPLIKLSNGKIPAQTTPLVCFVNGDEMTLTGE